MWRKVAFSCRGRGISAEKTQTTTPTCKYQLLQSFLLTYLKHFCLCHQSEREKVDSRILDEALEDLALQHRAKLSALDLELKEDENKVRGGFERERVSERNGEPFLVWVGVANYFSCVGNVCTWMRLSFDSNT